MALLHLALEWQVADRFHVLTVDHGLRPEARMEAEAVAAHCGALGVQHEILTWGPPVGHVSQARARDARHRLLARAVRRQGGSHLLFGHTLDDQYETVMMRAQRGDRGLAGMRALSVSPVWPEGRGIKLARPLLGHRRGDLRNFLARAGVGWSDDPSNENTAFERVRIRRALVDGPADQMPDLERTYQTALAERHARDLKLAAWLGADVEAHADGLIVCQPADLSTPEFAEGLVYLLLAASGSDQPAALEGRLELARDVLADPKNWRSRTLGGAWLAPRRGCVHIARDPGAVPPLPKIRALECAIEPIVWDGRFEIVMGLDRGSDLRGGSETFAVSPLARAGFPMFENEHALLRGLVGERLDSVRNVLGHENCV